MTGTSGMALVTNITGTTVLCTLYSVLYWYKLLVFGKLEYINVNIKIYFTWPCTTSLNGMWDNCNDP